MGGGTCLCLSPLDYQLSVCADPTVWEAGPAGLGSSICAQLVPAQGWGRLGHTRSLGLFHTPASSCYLGQFSSFLPNGQPSFKQLAIKEALLVNAVLVRTTESKH